MFQIYSPGNQTIESATSPAAEIAGDRLSEAIICDGERAESLARQLHSETESRMFLESATGLLIDPALDRSQRIDAVLHLLGRVAQSPRILLVSEASSHTAGTSSVCVRNDVCNLLQLSDVYSRPFEQWSNLAIRPDQRHFRRIVVRRIGFQHRAVVVPMPNEHSAAWLVAVSSADDSLRPLHRKKLLFRTAAALIQRLVDVAN